MTACMVNKTISTVDDTFWGTDFFALLLGHFNLSCVSIPFDSSHLRDNLKGMGRVGGVVCENNVSGISPPSASCIFIIF